MIVRSNVNIIRPNIRQNGRSQRFHPTILVTTWYFKDFGLRETGIFHTSCGQIGSWYGGKSASKSGGNSLQVRQRISR